MSDDAPMTFPDWHELDDVRHGIGPSLRTRQVRDVLRRVLSKTGALGITRIADVTEMDTVGIPVFVAYRPAVDYTEISMAQGKGLNAASALASALMEALERFVASKRRADVAATAVQLRDSAGAKVFSAADLGYGWVDDEYALDWVRGRTATGAVAVIPAATTLFPYSAPPAMGRLIRSSTTGIASGSTRCEALVHGLFEVIERDAVSRMIDGENGALVDLGRIDPVSTGLVEKLHAADLDLYVVDLTRLAALPTFFATVFPRSGLGPYVPVAGQGTHVSASVALQRALTEVAQSRIVAIQGSREDLIRHASDWQEDTDRAWSDWSALRARNDTGNGRPFAEEPWALESIADTLEALARILRYRGFNDIIAVDMTMPELDFAVVQVQVPGLIDSVINDGQRRVEATTAAGATREVFDAAAV